MTAINDLGILGAGNMAEALVRGVLAVKMLPAERVLACDPSEERRAVFAGLGCRVTDDPAQVAARPALLLAVKPQVLPVVLQEIAPRLKPDALVMSIAAGVPAARIAAALGAGVRVVRVMPNTPIMCGAGASAVAAGPNAGADDVEAVRALFAAGGAAWTVDESLMDAVTAVSGSGPAYVFRLAELMAEAGVQAGLPGELAEALARQTVVGAGALLGASQEAAGVLRQRVTSPGGTTAAALASFDRDDLPGTILRGVLAARDRGRELAGG